MRSRLVLAAAGAAAAVFVQGASAALSPAEQAWITPLIRIWNVQNSSHNAVVTQALKPKALIAGQKPDNLNLTNTLVALANCKQPKDLIRAAGAPPSKRLVGFRNALNSACIHDQNGANDYAKAIGAVTKGRTSQVGGFLKQGTLEFRKAGQQLTKAYNALQSLGATGPKA
jgi:hypothetical protein